VSAEESGKENGMGLEQTWRWFGPNDPITLKEVRQTGATGVVTALHQIPVGEVWSRDDIRTRKQLVEAEGLRWSVAESVPVHEDVKRRTGAYRQWIENYKQSIRNLGRSGIDIVCYNFMPVLDWVRTDLQIVYRDGSITTAFDADVFAAFDLCILRRPGAEEEYTAGRAERARRLYEGMTDVERDRLTRTVLLGFPGSLESYTLDRLRAAIAQYAGMTAADLRGHLQDFLKEIVPVAEESGVSMAVHADDPPWPLLGLPRVVTNADDVDQILAVSSSPANGLTLCTGSFGAGYANDLVAMATRFARRISFVHLRNVSRTEQQGFVEENHLEGDVDMYGVLRVLLLEQQRREREGRKDRRMPFRPDHGHLMQADMHRQGIYPGYSLFGRMRGLAELRGLEAGIRRSLELT
jgi:mannonate dehydratase